MVNMDLTGIDESVVEMFFVVACALYIFGTFASFDINVGRVALASYIFITWKGLD